MSNEDFVESVSEWIRLRGDGEGVGEVFRDLYNGLLEGIVHFSFIKNDGSVRSAYGTLNSEVIRKHIGERTGRENSRSRHNGLVHYYDLEKDDWRCFFADRIKDIDFDYYGL